jgi:hypothetical protein
MTIFLLALIGTLIVMAILVEGRLGFGRREALIGSGFVRGFVDYLMLNYLPSPAPLAAGNGSSGHSPSAECVCSPPQVLFLPRGGRNIRKRFEHLN